MSTFTEKASELGKEAGESLEQLGQTAGRKLDEARDSTGSALHAAASSVRTKGRQGAAAIHHLASNTADGLHDTASYIEDHDMKDTYMGLRKFVRQNLTGSLVAVLALGVFAGAALNRASHSCGKTSNGS